MKCGKCGKEVGQSVNFCPECGSEIVDVYGQTQLLTVDDYEETELLEPDKKNYEFNLPKKLLSEKEFYEQYASKKTKGWVTASVAMSFITAALCLLLLFIGNIFYIVDLIFYAAMGALILTKRKWGYVLATVIYCGIGMLMGLVAGGELSGVWSFVVGIFATINLKKVNDAFKTYKMSGQVPSEQI